MEEKNMCITCKSEVNNGFNYCPICGEPLSELAKTHEVQKTKNTQLKTLLKLIPHIKNSESLLEINKFIDYLQKNKD